RQLGVLLDEASRLYDLQRVRRRHHDLHEQRVGMQRDRCDELLELLGLEGLRPLLPRRGRWAQRDDSKHEGDDDLEARRHGGPPAAPAPDDGTEGSLRSGAPADYWTFGRHDPTKVPPRAVGAACDRLAARGAVHPSSRNATMIARTAFVSTLLVGVM